MPTLRVLLVEDDVLIRMSTAEMLMDPATIPTSPASSPRARTAGRTARRA